MSEEEAVSSGEDSYSESEEPTCSCCQGGPRESGPFVLPGGHHAPLVEGGEAAADVPRRYLKASRRAAFQQRFSERIGSELFCMTAEEARSPQWWWTGERARSCFLSCPVTDTLSRQRRFSAVPSPRHPRPLPRSSCAHACWAYAGQMTALSRSTAPQPTWRPADKTRPPWTRRRAAPVEHPVRAEPCVVSSALRGRKGLSECRSQRSPPCAL